MTNHLRIMLEIGPKGKRLAAVAPDWPGLERGAKTEQAAIDRLLSYVPRYTPVAKLAGMQAAFATITAADVVERYTGVGGTDFWGISFAFSSIDHQVMSGEALERELTLMRACWAFFDNVRSRVSAEMQRGPHQRHSPDSTGTHDVGRQIPVWRSAWEHLDGFFARARVSQKDAAASLRMEPPAGNSSGNRWVCGA